MAPQVAPLLRLLDAVGAMGAGLGLGLVYTLLRLFAGRGRIRLFFCDLLIFLLAAVVMVSFSVSKTYTGQLRWYMNAGALAGFFACRELVAPPVNRFAAAAVRVVTAPFRFATAQLFLPLGRFFAQKYLAARKRRAGRRKTSAKHLHKQKKMLYNSK